MIRRNAEQGVPQRNPLQELTEEVLICLRDYLGFALAVAVVPRLVRTFKVDVEAVIAGCFVAIIPPICLTNIKKIA